jgi:hypothetical protein
VVDQEAQELYTATQRLDEVERQHLSLKTSLEHEVQTVLTRQQEVRT